MVRGRAYGRHPAPAHRLTVPQHSLSTSLSGMQVRVRLFAALRERAGTDELELELPDGARVADALTRLHDVVDGVPVVMAVNQEYAAEDTGNRQGFRQVGC